MRMNAASDPMAAAGSSNAAIAHARRPHAQMETRNFVVRAFTIRIVRLSIVADVRRDSSATPRMSVGHIMADQVEVRRTHF